MKLYRVLLLFLFLTGSYTGVFAQCGTAYVSSDDTVVCVPKIIRFKVHSFPAGTTFEWDLGSGYVSADSGYTKLYSAGGDYTVKVKLKYLDGSTCVITMPGFIKAKAIPIPQYSISKNVICTYDDSFTLTDLTPKSATREWLVDNTLYSNGPRSLKAMFSKPSGYKGFTIFMKDSFGCEGKKSFDSVAFVTDSISVNFAASQLKGCYPKTIVFNNLTDTLGYKVASWNWSFPGASPATSSAYRPSNIVYNSKDTFDVALVLTTERGCVYRHSKPSYLMFADSVLISASFSKNILCASEALTVNLINTRSALPEVRVLPATHSETRVSATRRVFKFTDFGTYSLYMSDETNGCRSEKKYNAQIQVKGPVANFLIPDPVSCLRPDTFEVYDTSLLNPGVTRSLRWDLYNDSFPNISLQNGNTQPMNFVCSQYGFYSVRLIISGSNGCADTLIRKTAITVRKMQPNFTWQPKPACPAEFVFFTNATPRGTSKVPNRYRWTFYNLNNSVLRRDTVIDPRISYPDTGFYSVKLMAFNNLGCKDSITFTDTVEISKPRPRFMVIDSSVCYEKTIKVKAVYQDTGFYRDYSHRWFFQHKDSAKIRYTLDGDSAIGYFFLPGEYSIRYTRMSKRGTCPDTFYLSNRIRVSGALYVPSVNPVKVCNPYTATLEAKLLYNYNFVNNSIDPITHRWSHQHDTSYVSIRSPLLNPTNAYVKRPGQFFFKFRYTHPSGCHDSVYPSAMTSGVRAEFSPGNYACVDKPLSLNNRSDRDAVAYKWFLKDSGSGASFLPTDTSKNAKILFRNEGVFKVGLIVYGSGACTDTMINTLYVNNIRASFSSEDTLNYCAPIIARVTAKRHPAIVDYRWYLGDGDSVTNKLSSFAHLYKTNTGPPGSDVKLVVIAYGCNDTLDRKGYIKVIGPIPKFSLSNQTGCETLRVNFINQSLYYKRFFLEYGDGSVLDSVNFSHHYYKIFDRSLPSQTFKPYLSVIDSFGCFVQYHGDSVTVLKGPDANFTVNRDTGCAALDVTFRNTTIGGVSFKWDFDGNNVADNVTFAPRFVYSAGEYTPILVAKASNGCEDTAKGHVRIKAYAPPVASFTVSDDSICYNGKIRFTGSALPSVSDIKSWYWDFGDPYTARDTSTLKDPEYNFRKIFLNQIVLQVTDKNNCTDTADRFIFVNDTAGPVSEPMHYVSVSNNKDIDIAWGKSRFPEFSSYNLFNDNSNSYTLLYSSPNRNDTVFRVLSSSGINVAASRYCYVIRTKDRCQNLGAVTYPHCTVFLEVSNDTANELQLNWLPYEGWGNGNVVKYRIYRNENGGSFRLYDSVSGSNTAYTDRMLCPKTYCYYVEAVQKNGRWTSRSNTVCRMPKYVNPSEGVNAVRTTVLDGNKTYTQWNRYKSIRNVDHYIISRSYPGASEDNYYALSDSLGFIDTDPGLSTQRLSYTYKIRVSDHCGKESAKSPENKTILLSGRSDGYLAKLQWSEYRKWYSGVRQYNVLVREDNTFKVAGSLGSDTTAFDFDFMNTRLDDSVCFKIQAIKDTSVFIESMSNMLCLIADAKIWVPNAFSPNKDGKNEVFIPRAVLIFNQTGNPILDYRLEIYNRWGEQIFRSDDVNTGWDGTFRGETVQEGHYLYKVRALALDGVTAFNLEGIILLLR